MGDWEKFLGRMEILGSVIFEGCGYGWGVVLFGYW